MEMSARKVVWSTVRQSGREKRWNEGKAEKENKRWFPYFHLILCPCVLFFSKPPKKFNKSAALFFFFLSFHPPFFFLHPTALPLHPHTASHSALILLFPRSLSSLTRVNDCCSLLLFPPPWLCVSAVSVCAFVHMWLCTTIYACVWDPVMRSWIRNGHI